MKHLKIILSMALAVFCFTAVNAQSTKAQTKKLKTATALYQCPMKCEGEKTYTKAGKCPVCNMSLKKLSKPEVAIAYQCPMKCEGDKTYAQQGKCPKCNTDLLKLAPKNDAQNHEGHNYN